MGKIEDCPARTLETKEKARETVRVHGGEDAEDFK